MTLEGPQPLDDVRVLLVRSMRESIERAQDTAERAQETTQEHIKECFKLSLAAVEWRTSAAATLAAHTEDLREIKNTNKWVLLTVLGLLITIVGTLVTTLGVVIWDRLNHNSHIERVAQQLDGSLRDGP